MPTSPLRGLWRTRARVRSKKRPTPPFAPNATFFGRSSTPCTSPMSIQAGLHRARSHRVVLPRRANGMTPELNSRPHIAVGCRLNEKAQPFRVLHMPERALRLNGPSLEIIERCDGNHTVREIITDLQKKYLKAQPEKIESDILEYLGR